MQKINYYGRKCITKIDLSYKTSNFTFGSIIYQSKLFNFSTSVMTFIFIFNSFVVFPQMREKVKEFKLLKDGVFRWLRARMLPQDALKSQRSRIRERTYSCIKLFIKYFRQVH